MLRTLKTFRKCFQSFVSSSHFSTGKDQHPEHSPTISSEGRKEEGKNKPLVLKRKVQQNPYGKELDFKEKVESGGFIDKSLELEKTTYWRTIMISNYPRSGKSMLLNMAYYFYNIAYSEGPKASVTQNSQIEEAKSQILGK